MLKRVFMMILVGAASHSAVLVEDQNGPIDVHQSDNVRDIQKTRTKKPRRKSYFGGHIANGFELRKTHRAAVGTTIGGVLGMAGVNIELNFNPYNSLVAGFGGGSGYNSFSFQWKRMISGKSVMPYISAGYARWYSLQQIENENQVKPEIITQKLMAFDDIRKDGRLSVDLLTPSLGVQYIQLEGDWTGLSVGLEVNLLFSLQRFAAVPFGSIVTMYYF